jgi:hypothetical protein
MCTAHGKHIALSHQSFTAPITTPLQIKSAIGLTSLLIGPKPAAKHSCKKMYLDLSLLYYQNLFKNFTSNQRNY